jgi:hypothetical protein
MQKGRPKRPAFLFFAWPGLASHPLPGTAGSVATWRMQERRSPAQQGRITRQPTGSGAHGRLDRAGGGREPWSMALQHLPLLPWVDCRSARATSRLVETGASAARSPGERRPSRSVQVCCAGNCGGGGGMHGRAVPAYRRWADSGGPIHVRLAQAGSRCEPCRRTSSDAARGLGPVSSDACTSPAAPAGPEADRAGLLTLQDAP